MPRGWISLIAPAAHPYRRSHRRSPPIKPPPSTQRFSADRAASAPGSFSDRYWRRSSQRRAHRQFQMRAPLQPCRCCSHGQTILDDLQDSLHRRVISLRFCAAFVYRQTGTTDGAPGPCQYAFTNRHLRLVGRPSAPTSPPPAGKIACGTTSSTRPAFSACRGRSCLPVSIISSAVLTPISRGKRCVPPEPAAGQAVPPASRVGFFVIATDTYFMTGWRQPGPPPRQRRG